MTTDFDDILGGTPSPSVDDDETPRRRAGRPTKAEATEREFAEKAQTVIDRGVRVDWLAQAFGLSRKMVVAKLVKAPVLRRDDLGNPFYSVAVAAPYLLTANSVIKQEVLNEIKATDLPERLREGFWNAKIKEMKFRVLAGELWPTESVMEVLADTFQLIAAKTKLWVDDLEEVSQLSDDQRRSLTEMVDALITEIRAGLIERAESKVTDSYVAELDA